MKARLYLKAAIVTVLTIALAALLLWLGVETKQRVKEIETQWIEHNDYASATTYALAQINTHFGYGGFIHHFKNYILHQSGDYPPLIEEDLAETHRAIDTYRRLARTDRELEALDTLTHVVNIYQMKYEFARRLVAEGKPPHEIELHVQVNDSPAFEAIAFLTKNALEDSAQSVTNTSKAIRETTDLVNLGGLLIPVIVMGGGVIILFLKRIVDANKATDEARNYAESLIQAAPESWLIVDGRGRIRGTNTQTVKLLGYTREEMDGMSIETLMPERLRHSHVALRDGFFGAPAVRPLDQAKNLVARDKAGREFPVEISLSHTHRDGELFVIAAMRDISERRAAEQRQRLTQQVFDITAEPILITDAGERIVEMNEALCTLTGYSRNELLGKRPAVLSSGRHEADHYRALWDALNTRRHWQGEMWNRHKDGHLYPSQVTISSVKDDSGAVTNFVAVYSDISIFKENQERLELLAHFDPLTGLPNRMLFHDRLRSSRARAHRLGTIMAVMYVDLDGFKAVNDTLGHDAGDKLLSQAAAGLRASVREDDTIARLGGDEFAVLFNGITSMEYVAPLAQRLINNLSMCVDHSPAPLTVSASVGVAIYPSDAESEEQLLRVADVAMYEAKRSGKNRFCFYHDIAADVG